MYENGVWEHRIVPVVWIISDWFQQTDQLQLKVGTYDFQYDDQMWVCLS